MGSQTKPTKYTPAPLYGDAGLIYIIYHAQTESKPNGQKKIGGCRPALSKITKQIGYASGSGAYYSLLMGREFKPGRWSVLLDFDDASQSGIVLIKLIMDQYGTPKQNTPPSWVPLYMLRRCPTERLYHLQDHVHTPGRQL